MPDNTQMDEILRELAELRAEVASLRSSASRAAASEQAAKPQPQSGLDSESSRRQLLQRGGVAVGAGLAAATVFAKPAAAASGDPVLQDQATTGSGTTRIDSSIDGTTVGGAAIRGVSTAATGLSIGVQGDAASTGGGGVAGYSSATSGPAFGVYGQTTSTGGAGVSGRSLATTGATVGVFGNAFSSEGSGVTGIAESATGSPSGVYGQATNSQFGNGVFGFGGLFGIFGFSPNGVGGNFQGTRSALLLGPNGVAPAQRVDPHAKGEIYFDDANDLWLCTANGSPGTWAKLNGPVVDAPTPFRVYDSRFVDGPLAGGANRTVSVQNAINITTGAVVQANAVPAGATGIFFNVAITSTVGAGFLAATPGDAASFSSASINWGGPGVTLNNGTMVKLDANRQLKMFAGGSAGSSTQFIIDVTGIIT